MAGFFKALFISAAILCFFAMFFLTFLIAPMLVLVIFYFAIDASDRRRKEAKRKAERAKEAEGIAPAQPERPPLEYNEDERPNGANGLVGARGSGLDQHEPRRTEQRFIATTPAEPEPTGMRMPPLAHTPNRVANGSAGEPAGDEPTYAAVAGDEGRIPEHAFVGAHQDLASAEAAADRVAAERSAAAAAQRAAALASQPPAGQTGAAATSGPGGSTPSTGTPPAPAGTSGSADDPGMAEFFGTSQPAVAKPSDPPPASTRAPEEPDQPPPPSTRPTPPDGSAA